MAKKIYTGFHAVEEKIRRLSSSDFRGISACVFYSKIGPRIKKILSAAKEAQIQIVQTDEAELDSMAKNLSVEARNHRGIILAVEGESENSANEIQFEQWISSCPQKATAVLLDSVTDPHNVGAVLRSCDQFGADLLIVSDHRSASDLAENEIVARSSAGASAWVKIAKVANLVRTAQILKSAGFWIFGAEADGEPLQKISFPEKICIVLGSEGSGIARLLREQCDKSVSIPTCGKIDSLNVSVAAGILLYERYRQILNA
jgi:23S rRNA (guanosine2251-2'-O)-methyltransferase